MTTRKRNARPPYGFALEVLRMLSSIEHDRCTEWPYGVTDGGYGMVYLGGRARCRRAHAVVCEWRHGAAPERTEAAHRCGNRLCVNPRHLRWATPTENSADKLEHGTLSLGKRNGRAVLTEDDVRQIRQSHADGVPTMRIAAEFRVSEHTVRCVVRRKTWAHVA